MKSLNYIYKTICDFNRQLLEDGLNLNDEYFIQILTSSLSEIQAVALAEQIQDIMPNAKIIGASVCGVIYHGEQFENETLISIEKFEKSEIITGIEDWRGKSPEDLVDRIVSPIENKNPKLVRIFFGNYYDYSHQFVEAFNLRHGHITLVGGIAGEVSSLKYPPFVFNAEGAVTNGVITAAVCSRELKVYIGVNSSNKAISPVYTITKSHDCLLEEIEDIPAYEWLQKNLGHLSMKGYNEWSDISSNDPLLRFHLILENHNGASRFLKYEEKTNQIFQYFSRSVEGTTFRLGYTSPTICVDKCHEICMEVVKNPIESFFCYTCLFRKLYFENCAHWELTPFKNNNLCGAFMLGEIGNINGTNELLNGSCVFCGIAENNVHIIPDMDAFEDLYKMEHENQELLEFVIKKQSEAISEENYTLLNRVFEQQNTSQIQLYIDPQLGMKNLIKFEEDKKEYAFDKLCLIHIENADLLTSYMGWESYYDYLLTLKPMVQEHLKAKDYARYVHTYNINYNTFALVSSSETDEEFFLHITRNLHKNFHFFKLDLSSMPIICRFAIVLYQSELLESGFNALLANEDSQSHYIICDSSSEEDVSTKQELKMIDILNSALEEDRIVPYYQGIFDNKLKKINKYEALMRIVDYDGNIYLPGEFLDVAKKYRMYLRLTETMIQKVLHDFGDTNQMVTINLSAYDIKSREFNENILLKLQDLPNPQNIVFEILEDEGFQDLAVLKKFIEEVRKFGVKIAIDDFGSGYSNLLELVKIRPDFLKIDGEIIREIHKNENNKIVLETIISLAQKLSVELIGEFVENIEIQEQLEFMGIDYSQGFYFSKPEPFHKLLVSKTAVSMNPLLP